MNKFNIDINGFKKYFNNYSICYAKKYNLTCSQSKYYISRRQIYNAIC